MPKWRKLPTKTLESFDFNDLPDDFTRLMWLLLQLCVCREGRGIDNPNWLRSRLFPTRADVTKEMIEKAMISYLGLGMVLRYQDHNGRNYFQITNWSKYQGRTSKEAESPYPSPELLQTNTRPTPELVASNSSTDADTDADADADEASIFASNSITESATGMDLTGELLNNVFDAWHEYFPSKPKPRQTARHKKKVRNRLKNQHFRENYRAALARAAESKVLDGESWFTFDFFVRNDDNYEKMLNGWMEWKDKELSSSKTQNDKSHIPVSVENADKLNDLMAKGEL